MFPGAPNSSPDAYYGWYECNCVPNALPESQSPYQLRQKSHAELGEYFQREYTMLRLLVRLA